MALLVAQRAFNGQGRIAEILVSEDAADGPAVLLRFGELAEQPGDLGNVFIRQFLALGAEAFPYFLPEATDIN